MRFERLNLNSLIWPTPTERVSDPLETSLNVGDFVKAKIGPAKGTIGIVVVERNANYLDKVDEVGDESIGVGFAEHENLEPDLKKAISGLTGSDDDIVTTIRWFDNVRQLQVISSTK